MALRAIGSTKKKQKPAIKFEAQSQPTKGPPPSIDKFYQKCEVCQLFVNSERQWEIHLAGLTSRTTFPHLLRFPVILSCPRPC
jgi:hypothetical protein